MALRLHHSLALVLALTAILASKPFPLAHIISSAPSMLIALGGENSLSNSLVWFRPRPADRRTGRPSSSARRRCARPCWRAPPGQTELYLTVLRSIIPLAHRRKASLWPRRWRSVAQAPTTRSLRRWRSPILVMRPSRVLPPVEFWRGVRP